jgi:hypothetical protein
LLIAVDTNIIAKGLNLARARINAQRF